MNKNGYPSFSIITPSFNQGKFIERTIKSVVGQNFPDVQYIMVDGGSKDGTADIIKKYSEKISVWISEPDKGQADAVNKGLKFATGDIIGWINSDDTYLEGALEKVAEVFSKNKEVEAVYGDFYYIDENDLIIRKRSVLPYIDYDLLLAHNYIGQPALFFSRKSIERIGPLDENLHYLLDWDLVMRLTKNCKCYHLNNYLATARIHKSTKTAEFGNSRNIEEFDLLQVRYRDKDRNYGLLYRLTTIYKRCKIVFDDGIVSFIKFYFKRANFSFSTFIKFFSWRIKY